MGKKINKYGHEDFQKQKFPAQETCKISAKNQNHHSHAARLRVDDHMRCEEGQLATRQALRARTTVAGGGSWHPASVGVRGRQHGDTAPDPLGLAGPTTAAASAVALL